jgi:hypothetical protein
MREEKIEKILLLLEKRIKWHSAASGVSQNPEAHIYILNELTCLKGDFLKILLAEPSSEQGEDELL